MRDQIKAEPLLRLLFQTANHYKKHYCFPSQLTVMAWLEAYYEIKISIATLNRWLRVTEDLGFINRKRRIKRDPRRGMIFKSTMYFITIKGLHHLKRLGYNVVDALKRAFAFIGRGRKKGNVASIGDILAGNFKSMLSPSNRSKILPSES